MKGNRGWGWWVDPEGLKPKVSNYSLTFRDRYSTELNSAPPYSFYPSLIPSPPTVFFSLSYPPLTHIHTPLCLSFPALSTHFCSRNLLHRPHHRIVGLFLKKKMKSSRGGGQRGIRGELTQTKDVVVVAAASLLKRLPLKVFFFFKKGSEMKRQKWNGGEIASTCFESL